MAKVLTHREAGRTKKMQDMHVVPEKRMESLPIHKKLQKLQLLTPSCHPEGKKAKKKT
jgi:hypothetical protein